MKRICLMMCLIALLSDVCYAALSGSWHGKLHIMPSVSLTVVIHLSVDSEGNTEVMMDSPDQGVYGLKGDVLYVSDDSLAISVASVGMTYSAVRMYNQLVGTFRQRSLEKGLMMIPGDGLPPRPQTPVPPYPYRTEPVVFESAMATLSGTLTLPTDGVDSDTPVVLMVTGSGQQNRDEEVFGHKPFAVIADCLARNGIASLRYDDRGFGQSTGDCRKSTTVDFALDAQAGIDWLRSSGRFARIGVLGHSEGAAIAFILGAEKSVDFAVALGAPAVRGDSILIDQNRRALIELGVSEEIVAKYMAALAELYGRIIAGDESYDIAAAADSIASGWSTSPEMSQMADNIRSVAQSTQTPWLKYFIRESPERYIVRTECPVLALYGGKDVQVSPEVNYDAMRWIAPANVTVRLYEGHNHLFQHAETGSVTEYRKISETISPDVLADIVGFIHGL